MKTRIISAIAFLIATLIVAKLLAPFLLLQMQVIIESTGDLVSWIYHNSLEIADVILVSDVLLGVVGLIVVIVTLRFLLLSPNFLRLFLTGSPNAGEYGSALGKVFTVGLANGVGVTLGLILLSPVMERFAAFLIKSFRSIL